jgi:NADP-dependent 3-hydroxy acid dehydrogenase YdfG
MNEIAQIAWVTGAGSGMGEASAMALPRQGYHWGADRAAKSAARQAAPCSTIEAQFGPSSARRHPAVRKN